MFSSQVPIPLAEKRSQQPQDAFQAQPQRIYTRFTFVLWARLTFYAHIVLGNLLDVVPDSWRNKLCSQDSSFSPFDHSWLALPGARMTADTLIQLAQSEVIHLLHQAQIAKQKYELSWSLKDAVDRIDILQRALGILSALSSQHSPLDPKPRIITQEHQVADDTTRITVLRALADALGEQYKHTSQIGDLDHQVHLLRTASKIINVEPEVAEAVQCDLGVALRLRFFDAADTLDIQQALDIHTQLISQHPPEDPLHPLFLYHLGHTLLIRNTKCGGEVDLNDSIAYLRTAVTFLPHSDSCRQTARFAYARALWQRHAVNPDVSLLHQSRAIYVDILRAQPSNHPDRWQLCYSLGACLGMLYEHTDDVTYLQEAIHYSRDALAHQHPESPNRVRSTFALAMTLTVRYRRLSQMQDLHKSISLLQGIYGVPHPAMYSVVLALATSLGLRYDALGALDDLDESIVMQRRVLGAYSIDKSARHYPACAVNLALSLQKRWNCTNLPQDSDEALALFREAVDVARGTYVYSQAVLNLTQCLVLHCEKSGDHRNLDEAISLCNNWLVYTHTGEQIKLRGHYLYTFGRAVLLRYQRSRNPTDVDRAISSYETVLACLPIGDTGRSRVIIAMADALLLRFTIFHNANDILTTEHHLLKTLANLAAENPDRSACLSKLVEVILVEKTSRFSISEALRRIIEMLNEPSQFAQDRVYNSSKAFKLLQPFSYIIRGNDHFRRQLLDAYTRATELLPQVARFGLDHTTRLQVLGNCDSLASDAAGCALLAGQLKLALQLLEQGRAIFWTQHLRLRSAFNGLPTDLTKELCETAAALGREPPLDSFHPMSLDDPEQAKTIRELEATRRRQLGDRFQELIQRVRLLPGLDRYMLSDSFQMLTESARHGPVVVLIGNNLCCQAVILKGPGIAYSLDFAGQSLERLRGYTQFMTVATRHARGHTRNRAMKAKASSGGKKLEAVLADLWFTVMKVVVKALQIVVRCFALPIFVSHKVSA